MAVRDYRLTTFPGGSALSGFRAAALLRRLQDAVPRVTGVSARHAHWVASDEELDAEATERLGALLTYGEPAPYLQETGARATVVVAPRLGTISPWASKATDIVHNCGIEVHRVERVTDYTLALEGDAPLTEEEWAAGAALLLLLRNLLARSIKLEAKRNAFEGKRKTKGQIAAIHFILKKPRVCL